MKRIQSACLMQTIQFRPKDNTLSPQETANAMQGELQLYLQKLDRCHTIYRIIEQSVQTDGSLVLRIMRQYNRYPCDGYLE